jgi:hypothetical protein
MSANLKELIDVVKFGVGLGIATDEALKDGFSWTDLLSLVPSLVKVPEVLEGIETVPEVIKNLTDEDRAVLKEEIGVGSCVGYF